nr:retrovirus-related Pol polyprotein from transposon TNT 1-94 [Tanacetum cinerariifolium]
MRVKSVNGKKYILVIVDDYSRFTWVKFLRSKDETPDLIIKFLKMIQTPYELLHSKLPDLSFFYVFGALCYPTNDSENLGKLQPNADIGIFIGYAPTKKAFRIYNRRTRRIVETIHVDFDELTSMASEQRSSGPALNEMTPGTISSGLVPTTSPSTSYVPPLRNDWDLLFQPMFDELLNLAGSKPCRKSFMSSNVLKRKGLILKNHLLQLPVDPDNPNHVFKLKNALYGLKQAPRTWYDMLSSFLITQDFSKGSVDPTLFIRKNGNDLLLDSSISVTAFADADHAGCQDTRRSTSGSVQFLGERLISWSSKRQKSAAISCTKAEYIALSGCYAQILWMRSQLSDYGLAFNKIPIYHFIKEQVDNGVIELYFVNTEYQLADLFTKALGRDRIEFLTNKLGMRSFTPETLKKLMNEEDE